jgi:hypothetical protein
MEAICSSETSVETRRNTRRHIPEDDTLYYVTCVHATLEVRCYGKPKLHNFRALTHSYETVLHLERDRSDERCDDDYQC